VHLPGPAADFDTVILAGGSAARMAGADKPALLVGGSPMVVSVARAAATAGTAQIIIVGPKRPGAVQAGLEMVAAALPGELRCVREEPAGQGPVAGMRRGLAEVTASWLVLLAADLPFLTGADLEPLLAEALSGQSQGAVIADKAGRPQWLASCWRASSVRLALAGYEGDSLRGLLEPLQPARLPALSFPLRPQSAEATGAAGAWLDCDTLDDLAAARRAWLARADEQPG
jgi:molybdopterin-guanine dinucleotide biosynthesis protein A